MSNPNKPVVDDPFDDGFVGAGRPLGVFPTPISEEDARQLEAAWNDPAFYNAVIDDIGVTAGYVPILPPEEEIQKLPRWARVAFAIRCARRVLPLFLRNWPTAPQSYIRSLVRAVELGDRSAAHAGAGEDWAPSAGALACAAYVCDAVNNAAIDRNRAVEVIKATSVAVTKFKDQAENIFDPYTTEILYGIISHVSGAIANAVAVSQKTRNAAEWGAKAIIRRDFDQLLRQTEKEKWTDDTPVPQSVFGPMWEGPPPEWWTDDILAGLPPEPTTETNASTNGHPATTKDAVTPQ